MTDDKEIYRSGQAYPQFWLHQADYIEHLATCALILVQIRLASVFTFDGHELSTVNRRFKICEDWFFVSFPFSADEVSQTLGHNICRKQYLNILLYAEREICHF